MEKYRIKREYYGSGKIFHETHYISKGYLFGKYFYQNGQKNVFYYKINDQFHGMRQTWNLCGTRYFIQKWKNNIHNGPEIIFRYEH